MTFAERRAVLAEQLQRLEDLARQALDVARALDEQARAAAEHTETFADDTAVARVAEASRRARQELGAAVRSARDAREGLR